MRELQTNADGRCDEPLLQGEDLLAGVYELHFRVGDYYRRRGVELAEPAFLDVVVLRVGLSDQGHYHVPLVSPYSYSTYRGSEATFFGGIPVSWRLLVVRSRRAAAGRRGFVWGAG